MKPEIIFSTVQGITRYNIKPLSRSEKSPLGSIYVSLNTDAKLEQGEVQEYFFSFSPQNVTRELLCSLEFSLVFACETLFDHKL